MAEKIQVLVVPVEEIPYLISMDNELSSMQKLVGGYIELVKTEEGFNILLNEEGKFLDLKPNIFIHKGMDYIAGQFFVCKDDGQGEMTSITKEEAEQFVEDYVMNKKVLPSLFF